MEKELLSETLQKMRKRIDFQMLVTMLNCEDVTKEKKLQLLSEQKESLEAELHLVTILQAVNSK